MTSLLGSEEPDQVAEGARGRVGSAVAIIVGPVYEERRGLGVLMAQALESRCSMWSSTLLDGQVGKYWRCCTSESGLNYNKRKNFDGLLHASDGAIG